MRSIMEEIILVPVGETALRFNGMITLNPVGGMIWHCLEQGMDREQILAAMLEEYEVDRPTAEADLDELLQGFCRAGLLNMED